MKLTTDPQCVLNLIFLSFISDVLSGKPYLGKPSDMWALGVVLFTMLYGQFPFYDSVPQELFSSESIYLRGGRFDRTGPPECLSPFPV